MLGNKTKKVFKILALPPSAESHTEYLFRDRPLEKYTVCLSNSFPRRSKTFLFLQNWGSLCFCFSWRKHHCNNEIYSNNCLSYDCWVYGDLIVKKVNNNEEFNCNCYMLLSYKIIIAVFNWFLVWFYYHYSTQTTTFTSTITIMTSQPVTNIFRLYYIYFICIFYFLSISTICLIQIRGLGPLKKRRVRFVRKKIWFCFLFIHWP